MNKNETISIKPMMNGYKIELNYRNAASDPDKAWDYNYINEEYMYKTWEEVVTWVENNTLEIPPAKI